MHSQGSAISIAGVVQKPKPQQARAEKELCVESYPCFCLSLQKHELDFKGPHSGLLPRFLSLLLGDCVARLCVRASGMAACPPLKQYDILSEGEFQKLMLSISL